MRRHLLQYPALAVLAFLALLICGMSSSPALAQSAASGTVTGVVKDATGALIPGATITLTDPAAKSTRTAVTNKDGAYVMPDVPPGTYNLTASKAGFSKDQISGQVVLVGTQATANFSMAVGAENTVIEVQGSTVDLQTLNASTGSTVDPALVASLPAINRDVSTFAQLQPGVAPGGQVAGTTSDQAVYQLDGGSNSSDMDGTMNAYTSGIEGSTTGGFIAGGASGVMPMPQDSVEEFKVSTTGQTADFNNSSGSQVQVVTKRGRDKIHGSVYEYYLDNNFNANTWQNNFLNAYTAKPSYHYSRYGASGGGPILPNLLGGRTYLFANYEGFRYPLSQTYERTIPSYQFLQSGQLTFAGATYSAATLTADDPRHLGMPAILKQYYNTELPVAGPTNNGATGLNGVAYPGGTFDQSCGTLTTSYSAYCDGVNVIGYKSNVRIPQRSDFLATRIDHDFGAKWHLNASYRYYRLINLTANQVDIGGKLPGDTLGQATAVTPRPQQPWFFVVGVTTNISSSLTNDFHYSYLRNNWQYQGVGAPPQVAGAAGAIEPLGEASNAVVLSPYNVNAQSIRTRTWNGKDNFFRDDLTKLKGNHLIQFGGIYQHNFNYHLRTDNGASINYTPTYQLGDTGGGGNINFGGTTVNGVCSGGLACAGANANIAYARILASYFGLVTDTQVANTYTNNNGTLNLNPPATPFGANTTVPYYNAYITDTWKLNPSVTVNVGLSYAIEMPPSERIGNQVMFTDTSGNAIRVQDFLAAKSASDLAGTVYNPTIAFALIKNVAGNRKYPYDPFYGAVSPRLSLAWTPKSSSNGINRFLGGSGGTVVRVGYGRLYGRINGSAQVLNPLLAPGLVLATQCKYLQASAANPNGVCNQTGFTDASVFRFGVDGVTPITANAPPPSVLPQPYRPGVDGPGVQLASPLDPALRPNDVDTFNVSIQRQINRKMQLEVGYIGRIIHHEFTSLSANQVPYNLAEGGQTFVSAYDAIERALGCNVSQSACLASTAASTTAGITAQPFFETALGGKSSTYCSSDSSCTAAVLRKQFSKFQKQQVFSLWQALDNNTNGANGAGFTFGRSLMGTPTSSAAYGSAGQIVTGLEEGLGAGYSNYNAGYISFRASGFHGLTFQENFTYGKALGLGAYNQTSSSIAAEDSFNLQQQYGVQSFDQRLIFNTFVVYNTPWYKNQTGILGRVLGGYSLSPVVSAGSGQPLQCVSNNNGQNFGGEDGANFTDSENCIFNQAVHGWAHTTRGIQPASPLPGYNTKGSGSAAVNIFTDPVGTYANVRPPILGLDTQDGGSGEIYGLGYLNLDFTIKKDVRIFEKYNVQLSGVMTNVMNHLDFSNPSLSLQSAPNFGVTKTQGNTPRQIQMGARIDF